MKKKLKGPMWLKVNDEKNSSSTTFLNRLDWKNWWTDGTAYVHPTAYIHVPHLKGKKWMKLGMDDTIHRVCCRHSSNPRLGMRNGELYWVVD